MSYTAGIALNMAALGFEPDTPHINCDGCGVRREVANRNGQPAAWFLNRKAPPGWAMERSESANGTVFRKDWCRECKPVKK